MNEETTEMLDEVAGDPPASESPADMEDTGPWYGETSLDNGDARWLDGKGYGSLGELVQAYRALERYQGKSVAVPGANAPDEDWQRLYCRLGCPGAPDGYSFDGVVAGGPEDEARLSWFRETAHRLGLSQRQAGGLLNAFVSRNHEIAAAAQQSAEKQAQAALGDLLAEWGPGAERNLELARRAVRALALTEGEMSALGRGIGSDVGLLQALVRLAPRLGEDAGVGRGRDALETSRSQARSRIAAIYADQSHPYHVADDPAHAAAVQDMLRLNELLHGEE